MNLALVVVGIAVGVCLTIRGVATLLQARLLSGGRIIAGIITIAAYLVSFVALNGVQLSSAWTASGIIFSIVIGAVGGFGWSRFSRLAAQQPFFTRLRIALRFDTRLTLIIGSVVLAIAVTYAFAELEAGDRQRHGADSFWLPFYEAWTASFAFWAVVGIIGTIVTLARPEDETYSERIRILFGGRSRPVLRYLEDQIRSLGYFTTTSSRELIIDEWNASMDAYRVRVVTKQNIVNLLHDQRASVDIGFAVQPDTFSPPPALLGELTALKVSGVNLLAGPIPVPASGLNYPRSITIDPGQEVEVEISRWGWFSVTQRHSFTPRRFTEEIVVSVTYLANTIGKTPEIRYSARTPTSDPDLTAHVMQRKLEYGNPLKPPPVRDVVADSLAYELTLTAPI